MHTGPVSGEYVSIWKKDNVPCYKCKADELYYRAWESSCGGYTDYELECRSCGHKWWSEGSDS